MNKSTVLLLFVVLFINSLAFADAKENLNIAVSEHPPYINQQHPSLGLITQVVTEAFALEKIATDVKFESWMDVEELIDFEKRFSFMWTMNPQREKKWLFSDSLYRSNIVVIANKEAKFYWQRYDQLRQYRLGLTKGQSYGELFDDYKQYLNYEESISDYISLKHLVARQTDAIFIEKLIGQYLTRFLSERQRNSIEFIERPEIKTETSYLVCAKSYSKCFSYLNRFNRGLKKLKSSGRYQQILNSDTNEKQ